MELCKTTKELSDFIIKYYYKPKIIRRKLEKKIKNMFDKEIKFYETRSRSMDDDEIYEFFDRRFRMRYLLFRLEFRDYDTLDYIDELCTKAHFAHILYLKMKKQISIDLGKLFINDLKKIIIGYVDYNFYRKIYDRKSEGVWKHYIKN